MDNILPQYEIKELPSRFIPYPKGVKIYVTPLTAGAAMNIAMVGRTNIDLMKETLDGIKTEGIPKNLLTPQDILFLGVYRNLVSSKHDKITVRTFCPKCLKENEESKSLSAIKFKEIEGFDPDCYPIQVDFDNYTMWFSFLTYKDFEFCMTKYNGHKLQQTALQIIKYTNKMTNETIKKPEFTLNSKDKTTGAIELYVENLRKILYNFVDEDKDTLEEVLNILEDYSLQPIEVQCQDELCKNIYNINIDDKDVLILPFRDSQKSTRVRIVLSKNDIDKSNNNETNESERSGITSRTTASTIEQTA